MKEEKREIKEKMKKNDLIIWIKAHKKQLVIAGISIPALIAIGVCVKNKDELILMVKNQLKKTDYNKLEMELKVQEVSQVIIDSSTHLIESHVESQEVFDIVEIIHRDPFEVNSHLRNLSSGCFASAEKKATALENGYILRSGQTWVESYTKGGLAA